MEIGRVTGIDAVEVDGAQEARLTLDVDPRHLALIPANADVQIRATTVFGNKYISFSSPASTPSSKRSPRLRHKWTRSS